MEISENDPLDLLRAIAKGKDPRRNSALWVMVQRLNDFGGPPSLTEWEELVELIELEYSEEWVPLAMSLRAAEILARYTHPHLKAIDAEQQVQVGDHLKPLSDDEIERFKLVFNDVF